MIASIELLYLRCREVPGTFLIETGNMQRIGLVFWITVFLWVCTSIVAFLVFGGYTALPIDLVFIGFLLLLIVVSKISKKANRLLGTNIWE